MAKSKIYFPCHEFSMASFVETSLQMCLVKNYVDDIHIHAFLLFFYCIPTYMLLYIFIENETVSINEMKKSSSFDKGDLAEMFSSSFSYNDALLILKYGIILEDQRLLYY